MSAIDPGLVGLWIAPGEDRTYEVDDGGGYHVAEPEAPLTIEDDGAVMLWLGEWHDRISGEDAAPIGRWLGRDSAAQWEFAADGAFRVTLGEQEDTGIWALRRNGGALWTRERVASLETDGAQITFHLRDGGTAHYGYTVGGGVWTLNDPTTWAELVRFVDPSSLAEDG